MSVCPPYFFEMIKPSPGEPEKLKFKAGVQLHGCQRRLPGQILSLCETPELGMGYKMDPEPPTRWSWVDKWQGITSWFLLGFSFYPVNRGWNDSQNLLSVSVCLTVLWQRSRLVAPTPVLMFHLYLEGILFNSDVFFFFFRRTFLFHKKTTSMQTTLWNE